MFRISRLISFLLAVLFAGCRAETAVHASAPELDCRTRYEIQAESEFDLLTFIHISSEDDRKTYVTETGSADLCVPGTYDVVLAVSDEFGNLTIRDVEIEVIKSISDSEQDENKEKHEDSSDPAMNEIKASEPVSSWTGTYSERPAQTPEPVTDESAFQAPPVVTQPVPDVPDLPPGGETHCWQEGNMTVCEWIGEWEEFEE